MHIGMLTLVAMLSVCGAAPEGFHYDQDHKLVENMPTATTDEFSAKVTVEGLRSFDNPFGGVSKEWFLRSWLDKKTRVVTHQLFAQFVYSAPNWAFFDTASDDHAQVLEVVSINRSVSMCDPATGCLFDETVGVTIPDSEVRERAADGFRIKIAARDSSWIILLVTPEMLTKQVAIVDQQLALLAK